MSNDELMTKLEIIGVNAFPFVIRISTFLRHSSFVLSHFRVVVASNTLLNQRFSIS